MVRIGKKVFSWNSTTFRIGGISSQGITSLDFGDKISDELVYGARRDGTALGVTAGQYEPDVATAKFLVAEWYGTSLQPASLGLMRKIMALAGPLGTLGMADIEFDMYLQFFEELQGTITVEFPTCRIVAPKDSVSRGTSAIETEVGIRIIDPIKRNGITLASQLRSLSF